jgi:hypothetical protein
MLAAPLPNVYGDWIAVRIDYYTPLGSAVTQDYLWSRTYEKWRLHRVTISPDVGPPLRFDLDLGPADGRDDGPEGPEILAAWG